MLIKETALIYDNPLPQLRSRQAFFPNVCELEDGTLAAAVVIGEAFESVDSTTYISLSRDGGRTWSAPRPLFDRAGQDPVCTDYCKFTALGGKRIAAMGYQYIRRDPALPIGNPENGGTLDDLLFWALSEDGGETWSAPREIACAWGPHAEASAPLTVLPDGTWITPITGFPDWEGKMHGRLCGRMLRSEDQGKTWNDDAVCMAFPGDKITCYEQRICRLASGVILCIGWNENTETGERLPNHFTYSLDNGKTFSAPRSTGVRGQASSLCALGGEKFLALHAVRRDTDRPGVYGYVVDFSSREWKIEEERLLWEPNTPVVKDLKMAEIFSFLKFGQPGAIRLRDGDLLMTHWYAENGQYKAAATRIAL